MRTTEVIYWRDLGTLLQRQAEILREEDARDTLAQHATVLEHQARRLNAAFTTQDTSVQPAI